MLRISLAKMFGIAALLSPIWPGCGIADDAAPRPQMTGKMSCTDFANTHKDAGLTRPKFNVSGYAFTVTPKSKTEFCATTDVSKLSVTKDVSSYYWFWTVLDTQKACEAAAAQRNAALKGFEQEHINDAISIVAGQTAKLRDAVKSKIPVCAATAAAAQMSLKTILDAAVKQALADTQTEWTAAVAKRDGGGSHTYKDDCSCAQ
jgi:hypothetical protein